MDAVTQLLHLRRNATHDFNGVIAWLENHAAYLERNGDWGRHDTPEKLAKVLNNRAEKLRRAVETLHGRSET